VNGARHPRPAAVLYDGMVVHARRGSVQHRFRRTLWMPMVDLDRLNELDHLWPLWSSRLPAIVHHRREDYGGDRKGANPSGATLATEVRDLVEERTGARPSGRVELLAHARTWGWLFNPLAVYYCHDEKGDTPVAAVLEVTNTPWGERTHYVVDLRDRGTASVRLAKDLHVSPFLSSNLDYEIRVPAPGDRCSVAITVRRGETVLLSAAMSLQRRRFNRRSLAGRLLRHPLLTHRVSSGIYTQALRLWRKGVPYVAHGSRRPPAAVRTRGGSPALSGAARDLH